MSAEVVRLAAQIRQLTAVPVEDQNELDYVQPMLQAIYHLFIADVNYAMANRMDALLWKTIKDTVDKMKAQKSALADNVISLGISWLCELTQQLQLNYELTSTQLPAFIRISDAIRDPNRQLRVIEKDYGQRFVYFSCLRLGDLFRYKGRLDECEDLYKRAVRTAPQFGDAWNQMGIVAQLRAKPCEVLYYGTRAVHADTAFPSASANIVLLLKKYAQNEDLPETATFADQYLTVIARTHFLLPVSDSLLSRVGSNLTEFRLLVPVIAILQPLGSSQDEQEMRRRLEKLLSLAYAAVCKKLTKRIHPVYLWSVCLLLRLPAVCRQPAGFLPELASMIDMSLVDIYHMAHFKCMADLFVYPVGYDQILKKLEELAEKKNDSKESETDPPTVPSTRRPRTLLRAPLPL